MKFCYIVYHTHHCAASNTLWQKKDKKKQTRKQLNPKLYIVNDGPRA